MPSSEVPASARAVQTLPTQAASVQTQPVQTQAVQTPPVLSGRTIRTLRRVNTLRTLRRDVALAAGLFVLLIAGNYGVPAYANTVAAPAAAPAPAPALQSLTVSAESVHSAVPHDSFTVTVPPPLQWPVSPASRIADGFGPRAAPCGGCSTFHDGVDFDAGYGAQVHAIAAGVVVETDNPNYSALGVHVTIQHLIDGQAITSVYAHMQTGSMRLKAGDSVTVGQVVGLVGSTGASTGAHLHFEVHVGGAAVNPLSWMHARLG